MVVFPIAELAGGHIFEVGGYGTVYVTSLFACTCGLLYVIIVVPDETTKCKNSGNGLKWYIFTKIKGKFQFSGMKTALN